MRTVGSRDGFVTAGDLSDLSLLTDANRKQHAFRRSAKIQSGHSGYVRLQEGLSVHFSDVRELQSFTIETQTKPNFGIRVFLEGTVEAKIGDMAIPMAENTGETTGWKPVASLIAQLQPELFVRQARKGGHLRKVVVDMTPEWLESYCQGDEESLSIIREFSKCHLACRSWTPSVHTVAMVEQILNPPELPTLLYNFYLQSRVFVLIAESLQQLILEKDITPRNKLRSQDHQKLQKIDVFLAKNEGIQTTAKMLANEVGVSINTLQRLFHNAYGASVSSFVRQKKMEHARSLLESGSISIAEVSYIAGYGSPANFATAFKRQFGLSPSDVRFGA